MDGMFWDRIPDGEFYLNLRKFQQENNVELESLWLSHLSKHKRKYFKKLVESKHLRDGFDRLLAIPGLWNDMRLSTLHKLLSGRCDEVSSSIGNWTAS